MNMLLIIASAHAFFLVALLTAKKQKSLTDRILMAWLLLLGLHLLINNLATNESPISLMLLNISAGFPFLQGPMLFLYVKAMTSNQPKINIIDSLHFIPLLCFMGYQWLVLSSFNLGSGNHKIMHIFAMPLVFNVILLASVPLYCLVSLRLLKKHQLMIENRYAELSKINLSWLKVLTISLFIVWLVVLILFIYFNVFTDQKSHVTGHVIFATVTLFIYVIGYIGLTRSHVFIEGRVIDNSDLQSEANKNDSGDEKYKNSGLNDELAETINQDLTQLMKQQQPYLDEKINLQSLAEQLGVSSHHLSQVINNKNDQNFFEYINSHRLNLVIEKLNNSESDKKPILNLAYESGFGSKSTFNRLFKKKTGMTPMAYRKEIRIKQSNS